MTDPRVSVIMPAYNAGIFIREAVDSILHQSHSSFELIIINDGSTDGTKDILERYNNPRIRLYHQENRGISATLNRGIELAEGAYIARMDADDISHKHRLERQLDFLDRNPEVGMVGSNVQTMDPEGILHTPMYYPSNHHMITWSICFSNPFAHPSIMVRRSVLGTTQRYDPDTEPAEDYDLWRRLSGMTMLANLPETLLYLRRHDTCITRSQRERQIAASIQVARRMMEDILSQPMNEATVRGIWCRDVHQADTGAVNYIIFRLCRLFIARYNLTPQEASAVRNDAVRRMAGFSFKKRASVWKSFFLMCRINPVLSSRLLIDHILSQS